MHVHEQVLHRFPRAGLGLADGGRNLGRDGRLDRREVVLVEEPALAEGAREERDRAIYG
jgi:hypothetical protein